MSFNTKLILVLISLGCLWSCNTNSSKQKFSPITLDYTAKIPSEIAKQDLQALKAILEEAQTSIYAYTSPKELDSVFNEITTFQSDSIAYLDFIRRIAKFKSHIACGHSGWGHPKSYRTFRNQNMRFFPLNLSIKEGRYYINDKQYKHQGGLLLQGAEIRSINGIPVTEITAKLKQHMVKDGCSSAHGTKEIEQYFKMAYSNFIDNPNEFILEISNKGITQTIQVKALPLQEIKALHKPKTLVKKQNIQELQFKYHSNLKTGELTINSFRNERITQGGQEFISYIDSVFNLMQTNSTQNLIINLKGNTGGWTANGKHLFSYFINQPTKYINKVEVKQYTKYSFDSLIVSQPGYNDTLEFTKNTKGIYEWTNYPSLMAYPQKKQFTGRVFILVDEMSRSCSSVFTALMQDHTNAVIVGQETGSCKSGTSGMVMAIKLPLTNIPIHFSTARYHLNVNNTNNCRGVVPEIKTVIQQTNKTDADLEFIFGVLEKTAL